jgi:hypothetical protein
VFRHDVHDLRHPDHTGNSLIGRPSSACTMPEPSPRGATPNVSVYAMITRVLRPATWFGLLECKQAAEVPRRAPGRLRLYRKTPLFDRLVSFDVELKPVNGLFLDTPGDAGAWPGPAAADLVQLDPSQNVGRKGFGRDRGPRNGHKMIGTARTKHWNYSQFDFTSGPGRACMRSPSKGDRRCGTG